MGLHAPRDNLVRLYELCCRYVPMLNCVDAAKCKDVLRNFALEAASVVLLGDLISDTELSHYSSLFRAHFEAIKSTKKECNGDATYQCGLKARRELEGLLMAKVKSCNTEGKSTLCRLMKEAKEGREICDEDVVEHLFMLWAAGFEPVRISLAWILAFMGVHKNVYDDVRQEVNSLKKTFQGSTDTDILETLRAMEYTHNVYKETLRLKPPASYITFGLNPNEPGPYLLYDEALGRKLNVPNNWRIICAWTGVFYNDKEYKNAEEFHPERFAVSSHQFWVPFGGGIRECPARHLVKYEVLLFIFTLFYLYDTPSITATTETIEDKPNESPKTLQIKLE